MARTADHQAASPGMVMSGQRRSVRDRRAPEPAAVVLTPEGHRRLVARAVWLETERVPELVRNLNDHDQHGWTNGEYARARTELAHLISVLGQAITTDQLPENRDTVELGDEVVVEFAAGGTERFVVVDPVEAPLDELRISIESPLSQALIGRRVGEQVDVDAPAGLYQCRIVTARRHRGDVMGQQQSPTG
jgi:transcription elongation factor GreA